MHYTQGVNWASKKPFKNCKIEVQVVLKNVLKNFKSHKDLKVLMCLLCIPLIGNKFDIKDFHEVFLSLGPAPLSTLESEVNKYIESKQ